MAFTGDFRRLKGWAQHVAGLGKPNGKAQKAIAKAVGHEVREHLKIQFSRGIGPDGSPWKQTVRGRPALISRKLPGDFGSSPVAKGVFFFSRIKWLRAHHEGHTFPARSVAVASRFFTKSGKRLRLGSLERGLSKRVLKLTFVEERVVGAHVVKARRLPARPIYPTGRMPGPWAAAINRGIAKATAEIAAAMNKV